MVTNLGKSSPRRANQTLETSTDLPSFLGSMILDSGYFIPQRHLNAQAQRSA
jgi:hypothetical protein